MSRGSSHDQNVEQLARDLATAEGLDPNERVARVGAKAWPRWCEYRPQAQAHFTAERARAAAEEMTALGSMIPPQAEAYQNSPLLVVGQHDEGTIQQMRNCMQIGNVAGAVLCADGHVGYAQPVGGVVAYEDQISISGVGFDIACGNKAVRTDVRFEDIKDSVRIIMEEVWSTISFGLGRVNDERVEHELFDDSDAWRAADREDYRRKAHTQFGSCGTGNHYIDLMRDEDGFVWIGVHFGSRGLGHSTATKYLKLAGGKDTMHGPPTVVATDTEIGQRYLAAMDLCGRYAYGGRDWVVDRVRQIIGATVTDSIHNHHNYAWKENHHGRDLWVVRKGATPAFPGQRGFVGGSMGDDAVILEGVDSPEAKAGLYSTVHGAGRLFSRTMAKRTFTPEQMATWLQERGVLLVGGDLDESPMSYRRLPEVLAHHSASVRVLHTLRPFAVAMAAAGTEDPWRD